LAVYILTLLTFGIPKAFLFVQFLLVRENGGKHLLLLYITTHYRTIFVPDLKNQKKQDWTHYKQTLKARPRT